MTNHRVYTGIHSKWLCALEKVSLVVSVTAMCKMDENSKKLKAERPARRSNRVRWSYPASPLP
jgi:hypothetical protein